MPWSRFDREFTLVLDRGLDLHGLLPRYAHTVNGAADPDIPPQVVRRGDIVKFTIVNRSQWYTRGTCTAITSWCCPTTESQRPGVRYGWTRSTSRPGDVWNVAFRADNPGMWANHCHNLAHADAGMMLHLMYS